MLKYLIQDLTWALGYLPYGILAAGLLFVLFLIRNAGRMKQGRETLRIMPSVALWTYLLIILCLTLLSREQGSTNRVDLKIGSTLGINARNDAYVVENILLFVPYGFCLMWRAGGGKRWFRCVLLGVATTVAVECIQLLTGRGIFQVDDILTNGLGAALGVAIYLIAERIRCVFT